MRSHSQVWPAVALASLMLALVALPGSSSAAETGPVLSGTLPGNGYVVVQVDWNGVGEVELYLMSGGAPGGMSHGVAYIRPDGSTWSALGTSSGLIGNDECVILRTGPTGALSEGCGPSTAQRLVFGPPGSSGIGIVLREADGDAPGVWTLVVYQAYRPAWETAGTWTLKFEPGDAEVLGVRTSDRAFFATTADFEGGDALGVSGAGAFVSANVGSTIDFHVEGALLGSFRPDQVSGQTPGMTLEGPVGAVSCGCTFFSPLPTPEAPPGDYTVRLDRVAAGHQALTEANVFVVDILLPS